MIRDLTTGSVSRKLITFAIPMVMANLLQTVYNIVDMIVVGQFVGSAGLSAVSIGAAILHLLTFLAMGLCSAGQIIISQYVGAGDTKSVSKTIGSLFSLVVICSLAFTAVSLVFANTFLGWMNTPPEAFAEARAYCLTCFVGLFFTYGYNLVSSILRGMGDSRHPLVFIAIAAVINLVLDLVFVAGLSLGAFGAALATVIGQAVSFIASIVFLYKRKEAFHFDFKAESFRIDRGIFRRLVRLGIPLCLQSVAINFSMMFVSAFINAYGVIASAVTGIGDKLGIITAVVAASLSASGGAMVGQCLGARKTERIPRIIGFSLVVNLAFAAAFATVTLLMPRAIFGLFNTDPEVLDVALIYVPCAILNFFGFALRAPFFALINGIGYARLNLAVGLLDGVVCRIGLAMLLGLALGMGIRGFWYGSVLAGYVPFLIGGAYFVSGKWKTQRLLIAE